VSREQKAKRLRDSMRVTIGCGDDGLEAVVIGDHDLYRLTVEADGWRCPCPARMRDCAHVLAVKAVTAWRRP
jgi:hypothetical protein